MTKSRLALEITHWVIPEIDVPLSCEFTYDPQDPLAVTLVLDTEGVRPVTWILSRDLLADGLIAREGDGDVVLWPLLDHDGESDSFCLRVGGARTALFEIPTEPVTDWLERTYAMVPQGAELDGVDWDELVQLAE
ncbi:SsgA family sporulation/cell division regulator [Streptomyces sp. NPDC090106]|uniref:SsgA family sporulation/cell division regulator n=1 Tax=Streptomyces sp. NPDC090106 TaxID=3365946 RepID=UPI00382D43C5